MRKRQKGSITVVFIKKVLLLSFFAPRAPSRNPSFPPLRYFSIQTENMSSLKQQDYQIDNSNGYATVKLGERE
jgi:hypothetical protein